MLIRATIGLCTIREITLHGCSSDFHIQTMSRVLQVESHAGTDGDKGDVMNVSQIGQVIIFRSSRWHIKWHDFARAEQIVRFRSDYDVGCDEDRCVYCAHLRSRAAVRGGVGSPGA